MDPVTICNLALNEIGNQTTVNSVFPSDGSVAANVANLFYIPKVQMLLRAANWDFARKQLALAQLRATIVGGTSSGDPPPQPWNFEYGYPSDCVRARFLVPTYNATPAGVPLTTASSLAVPPASANTRIPFVISADSNPSNTTITVKVILTNLPQAQLVYTQDLSLFPDLWDSQFSAAVTATLGAYFINALARDRAQMQEQIGIARNVLDSARAMNGNEGLTSVDHTPDWMTVRDSFGGGFGPAALGPNGVYFPNYDMAEFPGGQFY